MPKIQKTRVGATEPEMRKTVTVVDGDSKCYSPPKPWSSGRVMTKEQRARKQAVDRQAQRKRRNKREARIAQLEAELAAAQSKQLLNSGHPDPGEEDRVQVSPQSDTAVSDMDMRNIIDPAAWIESQPAGLSTSKAPDGAGRETADYDLIGQVLPTFTPTDYIAQNSLFSGSILSTAPYTSNIFALPSPGSSLHTSLSDDGECRQSSCSSIINPQPCIDISAHNIAAGLQYCSPLEAGYESQAIIEGSILYPHPIFSGADPAVTQPYESTNTTASCNTELDKVRYLHMSEVILEERASQDFLVRVIFHGWENVERQRTLCPLWRMLRRIDDLIFCNSSDITRLVMMATIHKMLLCRVKADSFEELPPWYRPRPTQQRFPHEAAMDYFAWPGLRERLVLSEKCILTDLFWQNFSRSFRFHWPYTLMETCSIDNRSGYIQFSSTFRNHLREIRNWRMDHGFFRMFPELYDDITPVEKICPELDLPSASITTTLNQHGCSHTEPWEEGREGRVSLVHLP